MLNTSTSGATGPTTPAPVPAPANEAKTSCAALVLTAVGQATSLATHDQPLGGPLFEGAMLVKIALVAARVCWTHETVK